MGAPCRPMEGSGGEEGMEVELATGVKSSRRKGPQPATASGEQGRGGRGRRRKSGGASPATQGGTGRQMSLTAMFSKG